MKAAVSVVRGLPVEVEVEPILAWRSWTLTGRRDGEGLLLRPVTAGSRAWRPREIAQATCRLAWSHEAPERRLQLRTPCDPRGRPAPPDALPGGPRTGRALGTRHRARARLSGAVRLPAATPPDLSVLLLAGERGGVHARRRLLVRAGPAGADVRAPSRRGGGERHATAPHPARPHRGSPAPGDVRGGRARRLIQIDLPTARPSGRRPGRTNRRPSTSVPWSSARRTARLISGSDRSRDAVVVLDGHARPRIRVADAHDDRRAGSGPLPRGIQHALDDLPGACRIHVEHPELNEGAPQGKATDCSCGTIAGA